MSEILLFLVQQCSYLYERCGFRFIDSRVSESFGGDAYLVLQSPAVRMRFVKDRGQFFMDFQGCGKGKKNKWYSLDLVRQLVLGGNEHGAFMDEANAAFVEAHIEQIIQAFSATAIAATTRTLDKFALARSRRLFGNP